MSPLVFRGQFSDDNEAHAQENGPYKWQEKSAVVARHPTTSTPICAIRLP